MPIKIIDPTTPTRRFQTVVSREDITKDTPEKSLVEGKKRTGGRNSTGRVTSAASSAAAHKQAYRVIDFKRDKTGVPAKVAAIEYDPNRSARIALLHYVDGEKRYIICAGRPRSRRDGHVRARSRHPGRQCAAAEEYPGRHGGSQHRTAARQGRADGALGRCAGAAGFREGGIALLKLPSGEVRRVCRSTAWRRSARSATSSTKMCRSAKPDVRAGWARRPHNRGVTMNPVDHPHGGGEGKTSGGRHPVTPWGQPTRGFKTRNNKRTDKLIVTRKAKKR